MNILRKFSARKLRLKYNFYFLILALFIGLIAFIYKVSRLNKQYFILGPQIYSRLVFLILT